MSKSIAELSSVNKLVTENVSIDLDAVVSVYVSQYETDLFNRKKDLSTKIKGVKGDLKMLDKQLEQSVDKSQFEGLTISLLKISSTVKEVEINWKNNDDGFAGSNIKIEVEIKELEKTDRYSRDSMVTTIKTKIPAKSIKDKNTWEKELEGLNGELLEVMADIKGVSRKERQVKGKISAMKLEAGGYTDLLDNPDLLQLVKLD